MLALLGFMFCLVYERTGSLFPVIALHALNNAIAYGVQTDGDGTAVSLVGGHGDARRLRARAAHARRAPAAPAA